MPRGRGKAAPATAMATADARLAKFAKRRETLRTKAAELATRCGVDVALVCTGPGGGGEGGCCWPSKEAVDAVVRRYNALEPAERGRYREDLADRVASGVDEERDKLARARQAGLAGALGSYDGSLEGMPEDKLRDLLAAIEAALVAARARALKLRAPPPVDRGTPSPGLVHDGRGDAEADSASATNNVAPPPRGEADAGAGGGGVGRPPSGENPTNPPPPSAGPIDAGEEEEEEGVAENVVAGEEDPGDDVQMLQPPGDADADDAEWLRSLVDDIKKQPQPPSKIEYINVGSFWMERDAYDFIRFDIGMPPPSVVPNYLDDDGGDGEPLKLWSWDNTMPPPPK